MRIRRADIIFFGAVFFFLSSCIFWQCNKNPSSVDRPLIVSAGPDSTVRLNQDISLAGSAAETGVPAPALIFSWKQVSGPDTAQILLPSSQITKVQFRQTGTYRISLTVSDGAKTKSDTVVYTVLASMLIVSAGPDTTVRLNEDVYLAGSASEDGVSDFIYSWNQISGPDTAQIFFPSYQITKVQFRQTGIYQISLTASDGSKEKSDTATYTVLDSIIFMVLKPIEGDRVVIGDSVTIKWQIVTPLPQTMVDLSIDNGKTWSVLSVPSVLNDTQWVWHVDPALQPCDGCLVKVRDYMNSSHFALSGSFSLVSPAPPAMNPDTTRNPVPKLNYDYYLGAWTALPVFNPDSSIVSQNVDSFDISSTFAPTNFAFDFSGYINAPADGLYTFYCTSDDGSKLFIGGNDSCIVSNDGVKSAPQEASGSVELKKGYHIIRVVYFCASGLPVLTVSWQGPGIPKQTIGASVLFHELTPYIFQLLSPHGPHVYTLGDTVQITWYYKNSPTIAHYTELNLSLDGGKSFPIPLFTQPISTPPNDTGTVLWTIPNDTTYCTVHGLLQGVEYDRPQVNASTDAEFTIKK